jgi:CRISPR-associated protein Cmr5
VNRKRMEDMIVRVIDILNNDNTGIVTKDKKIPSNYTGYVSSLGPTIVQSGLIQALAFMEADKKERKKINDLFLKVLKGMKSIEESEKENLFIIVKNKTQNKPRWIKDQWKSLILDLTTASKLAMKTFEKEKEKEKESKE